MEQTTDVNALYAEMLSRISATVSHEIKNTLSIINENAGLLNDLASMVGEDDGVPSHQVDNRTTIIAQQVSRANTIMGNLNCLSHSADTPVNQARLQEILQLIVALTSRQAVTKAVEVCIECPHDISITTSLPTIETLLFVVLDNLYTAASEATTIQIKGETVGETTLITFTEDRPHTTIFDDYTLRTNEQALAELLKGSFQKNHDNIRITVASDLDGN